MERFLFGELKWVIGDDYKALLAMGDQVLLLSQVGCSSRGPERDLAWGRPATEASFAEEGGKEDSGSEEERSLGSRGGGVPFFVKRGDEPGV